MLQRGEVVKERYRIVRQLGQGGFGAVYRAWDIALKKPVALKLNLDNSAEAHRQFEREATLLASLDHPHLPRVSDHFVIPRNGQYLIMDFIEGEDLRQITLRGKVSEAQALAWIRPIIDALHYLHNLPKPIIHRDVKPSNIIISHSNNKPYLVDFGLAKVWSNQLKTTLGARSVTLGYSPPEQYSDRRTDARTDTYALAATLYTLLTGEVPPGSIPRMVRDELQPVRTISPQVSEEVSQAIFRAMRLEPEQRPQTIAAFASALPYSNRLPQAPFSAPSSVQTVPAPIPTSPALVTAEPVPPAPQKRNLLGLLLGIGIVALMVGIFIFALPRVLDRSGDPEIVVFEEGVTESPPTDEPTQLPTDEPTEQPTVEPTVEPTDEPTPQPTDEPTPQPVVEPFVCTDPIGCVQVERGEPIKIASALVISGANEQLGLDSQYGIEVALRQRGQLLGHDVTLQAEDDGCNMEGGQRAGQKIVSDDQIVGVIGTSCSGAAISMSPIVCSAGIVMISPSNTAPVLTNPAERQACYFRISPNDNLQGTVMADYVYNVLGVRRVAAIHDGDPYTESLAVAFRDRFLALGGEVVAFEVLSPTASDIATPLARIAGNEPELIYFPVFTTLGSSIARTARQNDSLRDVLLASSDAVYSPFFLDAAGSAATGMYVSSPNLTYGGDLYSTFLSDYRRMFGTAPLSVFHAHAYDATNMLLNAIEGVALEQDGVLLIGRQALIDAIAATSSLQGITGTLSCDTNGDCGDPVIVVSEVSGGEFNVIWP